jgi:hypothetical protein
MPFCTWLAPTGFLSRVGVPRSASAGRQGSLRRPVAAPRTCGCTRVGQAGGLTHWTSCRSAAVSTEGVAAYSFHLGKIYWAIGRGVTPCATESEAFGVRTRTRDLPLPCSLRGAEAAPWVGLRESGYGEPQPLTGDARTRAGPARRHAWRVVLTTSRSDVTYPLTATL